MEQISLTLSKANFQLPLDATLAIINKEDLGFIHFKYHWNSKLNSGFNSTWIWIIFS